MFALSEHPIAPRIPNPLSRKYSPFRHVLPIPSVSNHLMSEVSTPPCMIRSSTSFPISLSANAVMTAVFIPKQRLSPRMTLYSPPPSHALNDLAVCILPSPGSRRSITSPNDTASYVHSSLGLMQSSMRSSSVNTVPVSKIIRESLLEFLFIKPVSHKMLLHIGSRLFFVSGFYRFKYRTMIRHDLDILYRMKA